MQIRATGRNSRLPAGGENLFQKIKAMTLAAQQSGTEIIKLSIGQPSGPALFEARRKAAEIIMSDEESAHEYQDNGSLFVSDFAQRFILSQVPYPVQQAADAKEVSFLPLPGMKSALGMVILACGAGNPGAHVNVLTTTDPGYGTPAVWAGYLNASVNHTAIKLTPENNFRLDPLALPPGPDLIMTNYPHNPSGQVATREFWHKLCEWAEANDVRIFNDSAYSILNQSAEHCTLAEVAIHFKKLSWLEAYSASKAGNFTGWRIGAVIGSPDFVADLATIKGNTDSGFCAPQAGGILHLYENHMEIIRGVSEMYGCRLALLIPTLEDCGMRAAVLPGAGFFSLWQLPRYAFGQRIESSLQFNQLMIERTGIVGVHFPNYMRYAVCSNIEPVISKIKAGFSRAEISYAE